MRTALLLALSLLLSLAPCRRSTAEPLWVALGPHNDDHGLSVPSQGDGQNVPDTVGGSACRRLAEGSRYLYLQAAPDRLPPGRYEAYVTVEYFDGQPGIVNVEYDRATARPDLQSWYTLGDDVIVLGGSGQWRRATLRLPDARFGKGQNWQADFRLCGWSLVVRRAEVSLARPAEYVPGGTGPAALEACRAHAGPGMELTFGCVSARAGEAKLFRVLGATGVETYCTWQSVEDSAQSAWDWSEWDRQVEVLQQAGLKWVPAIIAGPGYTTPRWYREGPLSVPYVCLEHHQASKIQSLWNPAWRAWIDRFVGAFAERYRDRGVLESVLLGCSGTYGETLYPSGPEEGWPYAIPGPFHNHIGWWAGDDFAAADLRRALAARYGTVEALNRAWRFSYATWDAVRPFVPDTAPSARARLDLVTWYVQSMTDWAAFWAATARKHLPNTELYLCVGGAGEPILGADFSAQARAVAQSRVGLRVTNEGSDYAANFAVTREVATACRAFGLNLGIEPAGPVTAEGNVARIYNAAASGARALHCYTDNVLAGRDATERFRAYLPLLQRHTPVTWAGVYLSKASWALHPETQNQQFEVAKALRNRVDTYLADRSTLGAPGLRHLRVLALAAAPDAEPAEIAGLENWVREGGILVGQATAGGSLLRTPEGSDAGREALFAAPTAGTRLVRALPVGPPPRHFRLEIGKGNDADYLFGDWNGQEPGEPFPAIPGATKRWSGARAGICVPCDPAFDATLTLEAHLTGYSLPGLNRVLVNGQPVGVIERAGTQTLRFPVPRALLAQRTPCEVTLEITSFEPTDHGSQDARTLGLAVCVVDMCARGAEREAPARTALRLEMDWSEAASCLRRLGRGATLMVPEATPRALCEAVVQALQHPERLIPGARGLVLPNTDPDGLFPTQVEGGVLWYNSTAEARTVAGTPVAAHGMAFSPPTVKPASRVEVPAGPRRSNAPPGRRFRRPETTNGASCMKTWNVGIVGLRRGRGFVSLFAAHPRVKVTALCDLDTQTLADLGAAFALPDCALFTDFDEFVEVPTDIVVIATPIRLHSEQTIKSLEAGKHVLCEQTAAYTLPECEQIVAAVKRTGRTYMMAENYCYFHYVREWHRLASQGKLGHIFYAEAEYVHEIEDLLVDSTTGGYHWRHERPPIWYCAHCLGPLLMLMDDRIVQACGSQAGFHKRPEQSDHLGFLDMQVGLFRTQKGGIIKILRSQVAPRYPHLVYYSLYGTRGYVENGRTDADHGYLWMEGETPDGEHGHRAAQAIPCPIVDPDAPEEARHGGHGTSEFYLIRDFLDAIEQGVRPPIDVMRAMDYTVPGIIAHESSMSDGNWRDVPLFDW